MRTAALPDGRMRDGAAGADELADDVPKDIPRDMGRECSHAARADRGGCRNTRNDNDRVDWLRVGAANSSLGMHGSHALAAVNSTHCAPGAGSIFAGTRIASLASVFTATFL
jgi:hypothetical protein